MPKVPVPPNNHLPLRIPLPPPIEVAPSGTAAFVGYLGVSGMNSLYELWNYQSFAELFPDGKPPVTETNLAIQSFFANGGQRAWAAGAASASEADLTSATGLGALTAATTPWGLLCIPDAATVPSVYPAAAALCERQGAFLFIDPPSTVNSVADAQAWVATLPAGPNAAAFFPRPTSSSSASNAPSGAVAGIYARLDASNGVWKAASGTQATLTGFTGLTTPLTDADNATLNPLAVNCIRSFPSSGLVLWGARTLGGALNSDWKYINVRRTALMLQQSITAGCAWVSAYRSTALLWARLTQSIQDFLMSLFRLGAFQGVTAEQAFFVRCDDSTNTPTDISLGIVNLTFGFAPLRPAEFVILNLTLKVRP